MAAICKTAAGNPENQDRGAVIICDDSLVLIVADGAGGRSGAAEAASIAVELVRSNIERLHLRLNDTQACLKLLAEVDAAIARDPIAGETTFTLAVLDGGRVFGVSVGDSAAWIIAEDGRVTDLTQGQSRKPFVGLGCPRPFPFAARSKRGERLLLATDGLLKYASSESIAKTCHEGSVESSAARLIELVRYPSGEFPDDVTVILADL